jgi:hypothetical protein
MVNHGSLTLIRSQVTDNTAGPGTNGGTLNLGTADVQDSTISGNGAELCGGITNNGSLFLLRGSTVSDNRADGDGGICNSGTMRITNSTISNNSAGHGVGGIASSGDLRLANSTVTQNRLSGGCGSAPVCSPLAGGIGHSTVSSANRGSITMSQTIVAGNTKNHTPSDCNNVRSAGRNLVGAGTGCPNNGTTDQAVSPATVFTTVLGPLQDNGGPTRTHAPLPGSPAIATGGSTCPGTDQRGMPRPQGTNCDIGAVEAFVAATSALAWQNLPLPTRTGTFTVRFGAIPHQNRMNAVTGLAHGPVSNHPNQLGVIVRFNPSGYLDVYDGRVANYRADVAAPYTAGTRYAIRLVVNVASHTYSVYVRPAGGAERLLAGNYAFRAERQAVPWLDTWALKSWVGSHTVRNVTVQ